MLNILVVRGGAFPDDWLAALRRDGRFHCMDSAEWQAQPTRSGLAALLIATRTAAFPLLLRILAAPLRVPIIVASPSRSRRERRLLSEAGATVCMDLPLHARSVTALYVRLTRDAGLTVSGITLNPRDRSARAHSGVVFLNASEYDALHYLIAHHGRYVPSRELSEYVWPHRVFGRGDRTLGTYILRLRRKLAQIGLDRIISSAHRKGYATGLASAAAAEPEPSFMQGGSRPG